MTSELYIKYLLSTYYVPDPVLGARKPEQTVPHFTMIINLLEKQRIEQVIAL